MLGTSAAMAGATLIAKALGRGVGGEALHPLQISAGRFFFAFLAVSVAAAVLRPSFRAVPLRRIALRTVLGWLGSTCLFAAAVAMPLAEATAISFLSPFATMLFAIPLLGERIGPWRWAGAALAMAGGLVLIRPGTEAFQWAALIELASAVFMGLEAIVVKLLARSESAIRILFFNNAFGAALSATAAAFVWTWPTPVQWGMLAAVGLTVMGAQVCFIQAMKRGDASYVMPFFYTTLVFAAALDLAVFGDLPDALAVAGAGIVVAGALLVAWRERLRAG
jgi:drug/metabolite transporter (DMT)-like permease